MNVDLLEEDVIEEGEKKEIKDGEGSNDSTTSSSSTSSYSLLSDDFDEDHCIPPIAYGRMFVESTPLVMMMMTLTLMKTTVSLLSTMAECLVRATHPPLPMSMMILILNREFVLAVPIKWFVSLLY
ncbi:hypothetical protein CRG98_037392 [Punica granatum]|uniref:Uncharacterized protein n=1 Tax=Punica granatum TaxID=22663 RepID=A0A2I0IDZ6_PUNGR|nr:hypothetical protein CRG98_037392 [Punica granatum]